MTLQLTILIKVFMVIIMALSSGGSHFTVKSIHFSSAIKHSRSVKNSPGDFGLVVMERGNSYQIEMR